MERRRRPLLDEYYFVMDEWSSVMVMMVKWWQYVEGVRKWWKVMWIGNTQKKECLCYGGRANVDVRSPVSGQEEKGSWREERESWREEWVEGARESQEAMVPVHWDPTGFCLSFNSTVSFLPISWIWTTVCIHTLIWCYSKMVTLLPSAMFMLGLIRIKSILLIPEWGMREKFPLIPIPLAREWIAFERLRITHLLPDSSQALPFPLSLSLPFVPTRVSPYWLGKKLLSTV